MNSKPQKVIVLHLEAAEPSLIKKWCSEGKLPALNELKQKGVYCRLHTPGYIDSGCVWPTFSTGTNSGKHGMGFYPRQLKSGTYHIIKKYATDMKGEHFWDILSQNGKEMLVMDMPLTYPKPHFNGTMICNWGDEHDSHAPVSQPTSLIHEIIKEFGKNELNDWHQHRLSTKEEWKGFLNTVLKAIQLRSKVVRHLLKERDWECAVLNFGEIHWASHMAWHLHDKNHPEYDAEIAEYCGDIILQAYQALDNTIAQIIKEIPDDTTVMTISSLGMGVQVGGEMLLNDILQKLNLTPSKKQNEKGVLSRFKKRFLFGNQGMTYAVQQVERIVSPKMMMRAKSILPTKFWDKWTRWFLDLGNNRAESVVFQVPGDHSGLIRVNLKGREPKGKVNAGEGYSSVFRFLKEALLELKDAKTGEQVVKEVIDIKSRISGDMVDEIADIAVVWREGYPIEAIESSRIGRIELKEYHKRPGGHINNGFMIASGEPFRQGVELPITDLLNVVPTILSLFHFSIPDNLDGEIIREVFK